MQLSRYREPNDVTRARLSCSCHASIDLTIERSDVNLRHRAHLRRHVDQSAEEGVLEQGGHLRGEERAPW